MTYPSFSVPMSVASRPVRHLLLAALTCLAACGGGGNDSSAPAQQSAASASLQGNEVGAQLSTDPDDSSIGVFQMGSEATVLLAGTKNTAGVPTAITHAVVGGSSFDPANAASLSFDATGRVTSIVDPANGTLQLTYFKNDVVRANWSPAGSRESFEADLVGLMGAAAADATGAPAAGTHDAEAGSVMPKAVSGKGRITVACGSSPSFSQPEVVTDATLMVIRRYPEPGPGLGQRYETIATRAVSPGVFEYSIAPLRVGPSLADIQSPILTAINRACAANTAVSLNKDRIAEEIIKRAEAVGINIARASLMLALGRIKQVCLANTAWKIAKALDRESSIERATIVATAFRPPYGSKTQEWTIAATDTAVPDKQILLGDDGCPPIDVSGKWTGSAQQPGFTIPLYDYSVTLAQQGTSLSGTSRTSVTGSPQYFANMTLGGTISSSRLRLTEGSITSQQRPPGIVWCIKTMVLSVRKINGTKTMRGDWSAGTCIPGTIELSQSGG